MDNLVYASIDLETTGLDPDRHQVIQFGVVLDDLETPLDELPRMETLVIPGGDIIGDPFALHMHSDLLRRIAAIKAGKSNEPYCDIVGLGGVFYDFLQTHGWSFKQKLLVVGANYGSFDHQFLRRYPVYNNIKLAHRFVSIGSMYWVPTKHGSEVPTVLECWKIAYGDRLCPYDHTALADSMTVVELVRAARCFY